MKPVSLPVIDDWGRIWDLPPEERCPVCGQPDNAGDCFHTPLSNEEVVRLGGRFSMTDE